MNDEIENKVAEIVNRDFPGYKFSLMGDPEDETVQFIRLYDVADEDVKEFKNRLWDVIEEHLEDKDVSFIPSIVSHSNTAEFYSDRLRVPACVFIDEADLSLYGEALLKIKHALKNYDSPFETKCDFPSVKFPEQEKHTFGTSPVERFEDGGCGYAGEKCRLAA